MIRRYVIPAGLAGLLLGAQARAFEAFVQISRNGSSLPSDYTHSWLEISGFQHGVEQRTNLVTSPVPPPPEPKGLRATLQVGPDRMLARILDATCKGVRHDLVIQIPRGHDENVSVYTEIQFKGLLFDEVHCKFTDGDEHSLFDIGFEYSQMLVTITTADPSGIVAVGSGFDFAKLLEIQRPNLTPPVPGAYVNGNTPNSDADGDGLPDEWERTHGMNPLNASDANGDKDRDGFSNRDEYLAGTDPTSGTSFFRATIGGSGTEAPGMITLSWNSVPGKSYKILTTQDLTQPFTELQTIPAAAGSQTTTHQVPRTAGRFFKLSVVE